ncbi:MAG: biopolymer transporter ExbD [Byssovorax sp.]
MMAPTPLTPTQRAQIRRLSQPREVAPGDEAGELNVVPYLDIVTNLMMFVLAGVSVIFATTIHASPALAGPRHHDEPAKRALHLAARVTSEGVMLTTSSGPIATGCDTLGAGITVPARDGAQDTGALGRCARKIKSAHPDFAGEPQVTLSADPGVPYETVIAAMDALRADDQGALFPEVRFGVTR